jgi:two-component system chemotaxis response regulator CheY
MCGVEKILIADDAEFSRSRISRALNQAGYRVIEAQNGSEALSAYQNEKPDLVIMDIGMPVMDGLSALRQIMAIDPNAKIVMLSRIGQEKSVIEALEAGAETFLVKPFDSNYVLAAVDRVMA